MTEMRCVVCKEPLTVQEYHVFDPTTGPLIIGPGSRGQFSKRTSIYCENCGLEYHHLPKEQIREEE